MQIIFIFFLFFIYGSYANPVASLHTQKIPQSDCTNKDVVKEIIQNPYRSEESKEELRKLFSSPRSQGDKDWCYAFTAADLLSAEIGISVSAMHMAALYNNREYNDPDVFTFIGRSIKEILESFPDKEKELYEGGIIRNALEYAVQNGKICKQSDMPFNSNSGLNKILSHIEATEFINHLNRIKNDINNKTKSFEEACTELQNLFQNPIIEFSNFLNETISAERAAHILLSENLNTSFEKFIAESCGNNQIPVDHQLTVHSHRNIDLAGNRLFFQKLNEIMDRGKLVGIKYNPNYTNKNQHFNPSHASVIIARRWNSKKQICEFKIRDSREKNSCGLYKESIECDNEEGAFWISDEDLIKMTQKFTWIESDK